MEIKTFDVTIRDFCDGYSDTWQTSAAKGYCGRLDIGRVDEDNSTWYNQYQRVVATAFSGRPLPQMVWMQTGGGAMPQSYTMLPRNLQVIGLCGFVDSHFSVKGEGGGFFHSMLPHLQTYFSDRTLQVTVCVPTSGDAAEGFRDLKIGGETILAQEMRNAYYPGPWLRTVQVYFSERDCPAAQFARQYLHGQATKQDYLATALHWVARSQGKSIETLMAQHQWDAAAYPPKLWDDFAKVIYWVEATFPIYRPNMKGLDWGLYYDKFSANFYSPEVVENALAPLIQGGGKKDYAAIYESALDAARKTMGLTGVELHDLIKPHQARMCGR